LSRIQTKKEVANLPGDLAPEGRSSRELKGGSKPEERKPLGEARMLGRERVWKKEDAPEGKRIQRKGDHRGEMEARKKTDILGASKKVLQQEGGNGKKATGDKVHLYTRTQQQKRLGIWGRRGCGEKLAKRGVATEKADYWKLVFRVGNEKGGGGQREKKNGGEPNEAWVPTASGDFRNCGKAKRERRSLLSRGRYCGGIKKTDERCQHKISLKERRG